MDTTPEERAQAQAMRQGGNIDNNLSNNSVDILKKLDVLPDAELSSDARQKYVLIEVRSGENVRYLVRGNQYAAYHKDAAQTTLTTLKSFRLPGIEWNVLGGGRIIHSTDDHSIHIFGYSYGFPWKDDVFRHDITAQVLEKAYPSYTVTTSNEGY